MSDAAGLPTDERSPGATSLSRWQVGLLAAGAVVVLVVVVAYVWPTVGRSSSRVDVVVAGDGLVHDGQQVLERRLRERGLSVTSMVAGSARSAPTGRRSRISCAAPTRRWSSSRTAGRSPSATG